MSQDYIKVGVSISRNLLEKIDREAGRLNVTRSAWISMTLTKAMEQQDAIDMLGELLTVYKAQGIVAKDNGGGEAAT